jgi:hypothetical protein
VRRPLPSDAGSSPKDTQLSEQICASEHTLLFNSLIDSINKPTNEPYSIFFIVVASSIPTTSGIINSTSCAINPILFLSGSILISLYSTPRNNKVLSNAFSILLIFVLILSSDDVP